MFVLRRQNSVFNSLCSTSRLYFYLDCICTVIELSLNNTNTCFQLASTQENNVLLHLAWHLALEVRLLCSHVVKKKFIPGMKCLAFQQMVQPSLCDYSLQYTFHSIASTVLGFIISIASKKHHQVIAM